MKKNFMVLGHQNKRSYITALGRLRATDINKHIINITITTII